MTKREKFLKAVDVNKAPTPKEYAELLNIFWDSIEALVDGDAEFIALPINPRHVMMLTVLMENYLQSKLPDKLLHIMREGTD